MPVVKAGHWATVKPQWSRFSDYGLYKLNKGQGEEDHHYHDCDEYFIVTEGKGTLLLEGSQYEITPGDCVCIPMGGKHQILKALEDLTLIWIYDELRGQRRKGHIICEESRGEMFPAKVVKRGRWDEEKRRSHSDRREKSGIYPQTPKDFWK